MEGKWDFDLMCASISIAQALLIAAHFSNKMNKGEEGFVILNQSVSLRQGFYTTTLRLMKASELWLLLTTMSFTLLLLDSTDGSKCTNTVFALAFHHHSSEVR